MVWGNAAWKLETFVWIFNNVVIKDRNLVSVRPKSNSGMALRSK